MKLFIIFVMALTCVHAIFPKLVFKYSVEDGSKEETVLKVPKLNLFDKPTLFEKLADKPDLEKKILDKLTLFEKVVEDKKDKFEHSLLKFFDDKDNAKTIFDKFEEYKKVPAEPVKPILDKYEPYEKEPAVPVNPPPCECAKPDVCDDDGYKYFS